MNDVEPRPETARPERKTPRIRLTAVLALALLVAFGTWLLVRADDEPATENRPEPATAEATSVAALRALARTLDEPIYWAGPRAGMQYELSRTAGGRIYIRYLPQGVSIGDAAPKYLTIATYPVPNALAATRATGEAPGGVSVPLVGGGLAVYSTARPSSVYVAFPGSNRQVEVYHPSGETALQTATSGAITPIASPAAPRAMTPAQLRQAQAQVGHPIYWVGPRQNVTYEFTQLEDGRTYVRYLPDGVRIGDPRPNYVTIGTYPLKDALSAIRAAAKSPSATTFELPAGGLALYNRTAPTSVYFALPGDDHEIEVFAPSAPEARSLVQSGQVTPVG